MDTIFMAKFALTYGIVKAEIRIRDGNYVYAAYPMGNAGWLCSEWFSADECFATKEEAVRVAEKLRDAEVAALTEKLERLKKLTFKGE